MTDKIIDICNLPELIRIQLVGLTPDEIVQLAKGRIGTAGKLLHDWFDWDDKRVADKERRDAAVRIRNNVNPPCMPV